MGYVAYFFFLLFSHITRLGDVFYIEDLRQNMIICHGNVSFVRVYLVYYQWRTQDLSTAW